MESWRKVWRDGLAPQLSPKALAALRDALAGDDPRLLQGATTTPPPLQSVLGWPVEACCALAFCGWQGEGLETVEKVEQYYAERCFEADRLLDEQFAVRRFINWFDETPRDEMRRQLLEEVERSLALAGAAA